MRPCNSYDLPELEISRGQQHVIKAFDVAKPIWTNARKICHGYFTILCRALQNPLSIAHVILILKNENVFDIIASIRQLLKYEPKTEKAITKSIAGSPKGSNPHGDGVLVLAHKRGSYPMSKGGQRLYSTTTSAANTKTFDGKELLLKMEVQSGKYTGLYKMLKTEELLFASYHSIKSKPENLTPGTDEVTLDGFSPEVMKDLIADLHSEKFKFKPVRREFIPAATGKLRPLGIPSPRDKIIQKAMATLLELIYEQEFLDTSHGFRPKRGCHTAIAMINQWKGIKWAIEGDIKGFFDNVDHEILISLLEKKIKDQQFIDLTYKLIKAGYVEKGVKRDSLLGMPQGGIISPILSNIYLHEFDKFVAEMIEKKSVAKNKPATTRNPVYDKVTRRIQYLRDKYSDIKNRPEHIIAEIKSLIKERNLIPASLPNGNRIKYVRYADDWLIGLYGSEELAMKIRDEVSKFLHEKLKLELSVEKTKITDLHHDKAQFLGFFIRINKPKENKRKVALIKGTMRKVKVGHNVMTILAPTSKILEKLVKEGFMRVEKKGNKSKYVPTAKNAWIFLEHHGILNRYNWISRGLCNYYQVVNNRYILHTIVNYILRHSCAKTLARKLNLSSRAKVFAKYGRDLETKDKPIMKFYSESDFKWNPIWRMEIIRTSPFEALNWNLRTQVNFWDNCRVCGSSEKIEMHHVRHIRKSGNKISGFTQLMSKLNRKQIPVCQSCHVKIHKGTYDGMGLDHLWKRKSK